MPNNPYESPRSVEDAKGANSSVPIAVIAPAATVAILRLLESLLIPQDSMVIHIVLFYVLGGGAFAAIGLLMDRVELPFLPRLLVFYAAAIAAMCALLGIPLAVNTFGR